MEPVPPPPTPRELGEAVLQSLGRHPDTWLTTGELWDDIARHNPSLARRLSRAGGLSPLDATAQAIERLAAEGRCVLRPGEWAHLLSAKLPSSEDSSASALHPEPVPTPAPVPSPYTSMTDILTTTQTVVENAGTIASIITMLGAITRPLRRRADAPKAPTPFYLRDGTEIDLSQSSGNKHRRGSGSGDRSLRSKLQFWSGRE